MRPFLFLSFLLLHLTIHAQPRTGMLVLGSANSVALNKRIDIAYNLYERIGPDYIIVSGGCGAHGSLICEAEIMYNELIDKGVPDSVIFKEGNAKTTVQNYLFAKELTLSDGKTVIQKQDTLYVVSNHWHAIAVAARFRSDDQVYALYHIEGDIQPKVEDKVDYVGIQYGISDAAIFRSKGQWPTPEAVFEADGTRFFLFQDQWFKRDAQDNLQLQDPRTFPIGDIQGIKDVAVDQKQLEYWIVVKDGIQLYDRTKDALGKLVSFKEVIIGYPEDWDSKPIDASFIKENKFYLFKEGELLIAERTGQWFTFKESMNIREWLPDMPFSWGEGWVSAASYDPTHNTVTLFRNMEYLVISSDMMVQDGPKRLPFNWDNFYNQIKSLQ